MYKSSVLLLLVLTILRLAFGAPVGTEPKWEWRVVGGQNASNGAVPYQASLRSTDNVHFCGGSIINTRTILTAAQCVQGRTTTNTISVLGTNLLSSGGFAYGTYSIRIHNSFNPITLQNDIALIITNAAIQTSPFIQIKPIGTNNVGGGTIVTLTGWGTTSLPGSTPNNLQIIYLFSITNSQCSTYLSGVGSIAASQICTLTRSGQGACHGDAGSPLVTGGRVHGIVSWGVPCAKGYPDVYTRVASYQSWIASNQA